MLIASKSETRAVEQWKTLITKWSVLVGIIYLGLVYFSEELLVILTPPQYHNAYFLIPILLSAYIFRGFYCFSSSPLFFRKLTKFIPLITFSAGLFNILANIVLIPIIGVYGAALTTVLSFFLTSVLAEYFSKKAFRMQYEWSNIIKVFVPLGVLVGMVYVIHSLNKWEKFFIKLLFFGGYIIYLNIVFPNLKEEIMFVVRNLITLHQVF